MALRAIFVPNLGTPSNHFRQTNSQSGFRVHANIRKTSQAAAAEVSKAEIERRSANWPVNLWDHKFLASLSTEYGGEKFAEQIKELKDEVASMINDPNMRSLDKLEFIDAVQRLGLGYHFENEISDALGVIRDLQLNGCGSGFSDPHSTALLFRLLRQHGFHIQQEVLERFLENDEFEGMLEEDVVKGVLSLYEASFHGIKEESIIDKAKIVALKFLKSFDSDKLRYFPNNLARKVERVLDMPLRWRSNRSEARWFIDIYEQDPAMKPTLLRLAKLDYNFVQSHHRTEVTQMLRWWSELRVERFEVLRDRPMESYLWANIMWFEPRWGDTRVAVGKMAFLITMIDDVYDIFGTFEELELLSELISRWDISEIDKLPSVIRSTYFALYNYTNEMAYQVMRDRGVNVLPHMKMMLARLCKGYLREARWYNTGSAPAYEDYIDNSTNTIGGFILLFTYFLGMANCLNKDAMDFACNIPPILYNSSLILRLTNDLSTSPHELARGDNFKAVQCYQNQHGVSEEEAREAILALVDEAWKDMNQQEFVEYPSFVPKDFLKACLGLARASHFMYNYGDGHGHSDKETKDYLISLLVEPVSI